MFGNQNMKDMMSKLQDMKGAVEDSKKRLENIYVKGDALDGKVRFVFDLLGAFIISLWSLP